MKHTVAIVGAGGKMGRRAALAIKNNPGYKTYLYEKDDAAASRLEQDGLTVINHISAVSEADFVVVAVPDEAIGSVSDSVIQYMKEGSALIILDAAAVFVGEIPRRDGITQIITHPCHPGLFAEQPTEQARRDHFGGTATQDILVSLIEGSEEAFVIGTELCKTIFAPVGKAHRVTPHQFALLEPAMSEIVVATAATLMKASLDLAIKKGVPREAAEAFMAGHAQIALAIVFGVEPSPFSDAAKIAIQWGTREIIRPDWKRVFEDDTLRTAIHVMLYPEALEAESVAVGSRNGK